MKQEKQIIYKESININIIILKQIVDNYRYRYIIELFDLTDIAPLYVCYLYRNVKYDAYRKIDIN